MQKDLYEFTVTPRDIYAREVADRIKFVIEIPDTVDIEEQLKKKQKVFERLGLEYCRAIGYSASFCEIVKIEKV